MHLEPILASPVGGECDSRSVKPLCGVECTKLDSIQKLPRFRVRFPFITTMCCCYPTCFKCKTSGFHEGQTCAEKQAEELAVDAQVGLPVCSGTGEAVVRRRNRWCLLFVCCVQYCPECGVPTIRSEGCSQMICVCGAAWEWEGDDY